MKAEPPYDSRDGVSLGRVQFDKKFTGPLTAASTVQMTAVRTAVETSAGYVAIERLEGTLGGKRGSFVLQHNGVSRKGVQSLSVTVVPDSGTGELKGLSGSMRISDHNGKHEYEFDYDFA